MEKPRITEIKVRMDCNGCVQKIKRALHGINGIYDLYIDFPQQKITIIGWADPQKIAKALKKTRKTAVICSHAEPPDHDQPSEPAAADGEAPAAPAAPADRGSPPATEGGGPLPAPESTGQPPAEAQPESESPKEPRPRPPENPPISEAATSAPPNQPQVQTSRPKDIEEIHVIHHHAAERYGPRGYGGGQRNPTGGGPPPGLLRVEGPQPTHVTTYSYNAYRPPPHVTEYAYINRPSPPTYPQYYTRPMDQYYTYSHEEHRAGSNGNITSVFSDENPNACTIA